MPQQIDDLRAIGSNFKLLLNNNEYPCIILPQEPHVVYEYDHPKVIGYLYGEYAKFQEIKSEKQTKILTRKHVSDYLDYLKGKIHKEAKQAKVWLRCGKEGKNYYYDLGNGKDVIKINKKEICFIDKPEIYFKRETKFQKPQVLPDLKTPPEYLFNLFNYVNVKNKPHQILLLSYLVALLDPEINKFMLYLQGVPGSAKSTSLRFLRSLIDPCIDTSNVLSDGGLVNFKHSDTGIFQQTNIHYCLFYDDIAYFSKNDQKIMAKIITGIVDNQRELYTTNSQVLYDLKPCFALNGINLYITTGDLLERTLIIEIDRIDNDHDKRESDLWQEFQLDKSKLFGSLINTFHLALSTKVNFNPDIRIRMRDYANFMAKIAKVLGVNESEFFDYLKKNITTQDDQAIEFSPVGRTFLELMKAKENYFGYSKDFFKLLKDNLPEDIKVGNRADEFPSSLAKFGQAFKKIIVNLSNKGFSIKKTHRENGSYYNITKFAFKLNKEEEDDELPI